MKVKFQLEPNCHRSICDNRRWNGARALLVPFLHFVHRQTPRPQNAVRSKVAERFRREAPLICEAVSWRFLVNERQAYNFLPRQFSPDRFCETATLITVSCRLKSVGINVGHWSIDKLDEWIDSNVFGFFSSIKAMPCLPARYNQQQQSWCCFVSHNLNIFVVLVLSFRFIRPLDPGPIYREMAFFFF